MSFEWFRRLTRPTCKESLQVQNPLAGKPLRYLIGADDAGDGVDDEVTEVPYGARPVLVGISIGYCNLFDELNTGKLGPYLKDSDTAREYNEGQIDPKGPGWLTNLNVQFRRRENQGFEYIELDNPDAYSIEDVIGAIELAGTYGLKVIAKNPLLMNTGDAPRLYLEHSNVYGAIVEKDAAAPRGMHIIREAAGKPDLPIWFVSFGDAEDLAWAQFAAKSAADYRNMGVTYSPDGEYTSVQHIVRPRA